MAEGTTARLGDLAEIIGGLSSRECPKATKGQPPLKGMREAALVTMSAVGETIDQSKLQRVWVKDSHLDEQKHRSARLRPGDLVLVNRFTPKVYLVSPRETHAEGDASIRCVPANTLILIRPRGEGEELKARSRYLAWLLNHPKTQADLFLLMRGAEVKSLTCESLAALVIPVPAPDPGVQGTTTEGIIAELYEKLVALRAKQHEQLEIEHQLAQVRLYEVALGRRKLY